MDDSTSLVERLSLEPDNNMNFASSKDEQQLENDANQLVPNKSEESVYSDVLAIEKTQEDKEVELLQSMALMQHLDAKSTKALFRNILHIRHENIASDFAEFETFLVFFDALFVELVSSPTFSPVGGAQTVSFIAAFEQVLASLRKRDGRFKLVFLEDFDLLYEATAAINGALAFLRNALKRHIHKVDAFRDRVVSFSDVRSPDFESFVRQLRPSFSMTTSDPFSKEAAATLRLPDGLQLSLATLLHNTLFGLLKLNQGIVFLNGLDFDHKEISAFRCDPRNSFQRASTLVKHIDSLLASSCARICEKVKSERPQSMTFQRFDSEIDFWIVALGEFKQLYEKASGYDGRLVRDFALYLVVKSHIGINERAQQIDQAAAVRFEERFGDFLARLLGLASRLLLRADDSSSLPVIDLFDGRLLAAVCETLHTYINAKQKRYDILDSVLFTDFSQLCSRLNVSTLPYKAGTRVAVAEAESSQLREAAGDVIELRSDLINGFFDENLKETLLRVDFGTTIPNRNFSEEVFKDKHHWHSNRMLKEAPNLRQLPEKLGPGSERSCVSRPRPNKGRDAMWKLKKVQELYEWYQFYGVHLEGRIAERPVEFRANRAIPPLFEPLTSTRTLECSSSSSLLAEETVEAEVDKKSVKTKGKKNGKEEKKNQKKLSKVDEIRMANDARRNAEKSKAECEKVAFFKQVAAHTDSSILDQLTLVTVESQLERLREDLNRLKQTLSGLKRRALTVERKRREAVRFFEHLRKLTTAHQRGSCLLTPAQCTELNAYWQMLNLDVHLTSQPTDPPVLADVSSSSVNEYEKELLDLKTTLVDYQLEFGGRTLDVQSDPTPDSRVAFTPDGWQVRLLDAVDAGRSVLVVAPTSSGKTFVSYYAIEKTLRSSDDDIVVYVAPTKALVQQVAATVYARFRGKSMANDSHDRKVLGYFTRDYRLSVLECQVLVTVPQCLEVLLLSATEQSWSHRLRYVIFDELHCLGLNNSGISGGDNVSSWEHIIGLIPCPFIALSATIGNPQHLLHWLQAIETGKQTTDALLGRQRRGGPDAYRVELVTFGERYSELELYLYAPTPSSSSSSSGQQSQSEPDELLHLLHPFAAFSIEKLKMFGIPNDLCLTARQVYDLFNALRACAGSEQEMADLSPIAFFTSRGRVWLSRADLREYEAVLKSKFLDWLQSTKHEEARRAERVIKVLGSRIRAQLKLKSRTFRQNVYALTEMGRLIENLRSRQQLPALVFADDRRLGVEFARQFTEDLETAEKEFLSRPESIAKLRDYEKRLAKFEKEAQRRRERDSRKLVKKVETARGKQQNQIEVHDEEREDPLEPPTFPLDLSQFTLVPRGLHTDVFEKMRKRMMDRRDGVRDSTRMLLRCLERGVGYHHGGMATKERQAVEVLFRAGYLQVVFSTSTLALGIHMPCKTVVFAIDSVHLTPLQYRQMAGRAGRRGFDSAGSVVFLGVPTSKVSRLVSSGIGRLSGRNPFSISMLLRMLVLISNVENRPFAVAQCLQLLRNPLRLYADTNEDSASQERFSTLLRFFFAFGAHLLVRFHLLNRSVEPIGFAGMAAHLHYHEPGNFIFIYLLQSDALHRLVMNENLLREERLEQLVLVLCYLFTHRPLPPNAHYRRAATGPNSGVSKVLLGPLPNGVATQVRQYNRHVSVLLSQLLDRMSAAREQQPLCLPYSNIQVFANRSVEEESVLMNTLRKSCIRTAFQDQFIFLTGACTDKQFDFSASGRLVSALSEVNQFDARLLPTLAYPLCDSRGERVDLNAYALDFYRHRSRRVLERDSVSDTEAYYLLYDFQLMLQSILSILVQVAPDHDPLRGAFDEISHRFFSAFTDQYH